MGIFNEFNKKEKPVFTGSRFGFGGRGSASAPAGPTEPDVIASGGFVSDFTESGTHYRAHIFVDRGTTNFVVHSAPATATMDYLVVAGGGGGSRYGAGGAGGLRSTVDQTGGGGSLESAVPISAATYTITVGEGGRGTWGEGPNGNIATAGSDSSIAGPTFSTITSTGGGYGGTNGPPAPNNGGPGGSGGGANYVPGPSYGSGTANQGYDGGQGPGSNPAPYLGGGGGGAGGVGANSQPNYGGAGGPGVQVLGIAGPSSSSPSWGDPGPSPVNGYFGGGGGGATNPPSGNYNGGDGGDGGGGKGINLSDGGETGPFTDATKGSRGVDGTGGGGGGGRHGGSGIVICRYQVNNPISPKTRATGGIVTAYDPSSPSPMAGKTVHIFNEPGTFTTNPGSPFGIEYLIIAGGGGGGAQTNFSDASGGGGAGGVRCNTPEAPGPQRMPPYSVSANEPYTVEVGTGGEGGFNSSSTSCPQYQNTGQKGGDSNFYPTGTSYPSTQVYYVRANGGGRGGGYAANNNAWRAGGDGGNGGGSGGGSSGTNGGGVQNDPNIPNTRTQGNPGGNCGPNYQGGGGGGYTEAGSGGTSSSPFGGRGGAGFNCTITGASRGCAGGGGAGGMDPCRSPQYNGRPAPDHGGGDGGSPAPASQITTYFGEPGVMCTGGGGGGACASGSPSPVYSSFNDSKGYHQAGGVGGPGIIVIAYTTP